MANISLPVLLLENIVLFPENELKIDLDQKDMLSTIEVAKKYHDNHILLVPDKNPDQAKLKNLFKFGVVGKITNIITLPNGFKRITIMGRGRAKVLEYVVEDKSNNLIDAVITKVKNEPVDPKTRQDYIRKIIKDYHKLANNATYISNELLNIIENSQDLGLITDLLSSSLPFSFATKCKLLGEFNPLKRAELVLIEISQELDIIATEITIENKLKQRIDANQKEFVLREKIKILKEELGEVDDVENAIHKFKTQLNQLEASDQVKSRISDEINRLSVINATSPEYGNLYSYIELLLKMPWKVSSNDQDNLNEIINVLNQSHYGMQETKDRIVEFIAAKLNKARIKSPIICLVGPPGTGKTTIAMSIAKALNREFVKMSVGGLNDEAEIFGHRKTYVGAAPGKIIANIKKAGVNNPVFLIDEIDKITSDYKGDPASALLDVLDPELNHLFNDLYLDIPFNLKNVLFVTTANNENHIPPALRDRLEIIKITPYTIFEKEEIAANYLIPSIVTDYNLTGKLKFSASAINKIIENYTFEAGIRSLSKLIERIARKVVVEANPKTTLINPERLEDYLGKPTNPTDFYDLKPKIGVVNMLSVGGHEGLCLPVEVMLVPGEGKLITTGSIQKTMQQSIRVIISYLKSNASKYGVDPADERFKALDIHVHAVLTDLPKKGASAGVAICLALYSAVTKKVIPSDIAMTGELSLYGDIVPIGGVKEKLIAAYNNKIKLVFLPTKNKNDVKDIPAPVIEGLKIIYVNNMSEIIDYLNNRID